MLSPATLDTAVGLAELPDLIRGFGPVKDAARAKAEVRRSALLTRLYQVPEPALMSASRMFAVTGKPSPS